MRLLTDAHVGEGGPWDWHWDPQVLGALLAAETLYLLAVGPLRRRYGWAAKVAPRQVILYSLGVLSLFAALHTPLDTLSDEYLFSAHMTQHMLLVFIAPPLLLAGAPRWLLRRLMWFPSLLPVGRALTSGVTAFIVFNLALLFWHFPVLYEAALRNELVHVAEHATFVGASLLMWWPLLSPLPELPRPPAPLQLLYLLLLTVPMGIVGAVITFAGDVLYPSYAAAPRLWGISPLADQQFGGLIMKTVGLFVFTGIALVVFFRWAGREGDQAAVVGHGGNGQGTGQASKPGGP